MDDHLEMTWSSLVQAKEELDNMRQKFHEVQEVNQKMAESFEDCRAEIRNLSVAVKNIELENIGQKKMMEDMASKTTKELKSVESRVLRYAQGRASYWDPPIFPKIEQSLDDIRGRHDEASRDFRPRGIIPNPRAAAAVISTHDSENMRRLLRKKPV